MHPRQMAAVEYLPRLADARLGALLRELPAVMVTGPRAAGKTTSAGRLASEVLRLDEPAVAAAVRADPDAAGVEVKAGAAPDPRDARHLAWLRDELEEQFVCGIVLHTGPKPFEIGDRLWALPICALWASTG